MPKQITYEKDGYIYTYVLTENSPLRFNGVELSDDDIITKDGQVISNKLYGYKLFYTNEPKISAGTVFVSPTKTSYVKSIDFSKLETGNVGDFSNLQGLSIDEILSRIPSDATKRELTPIEGKVQEGFEYKFVENGETIRVRVHGPDQSAPLGSNAYDNWNVYHNADFPDEFEG